jgi:hypothetical protein
MPTLPTVTPKAFSMARLESAPHACTDPYPAGVDLASLTRWYGDHRFGSALFRGKPWLVAAEGLAEWARRAPTDAALRGRFSPAEGQMPQGIRLLSWPKRPSAQGSAGPSEQPKGVIHPEWRVFERMCIFGQHRRSGGRRLNLPRRRSGWTWGPTLKKSSRLWRLTSAR